MQYSEASTARDKYFLWALAAGVGGVGACCSAAAGLLFTESLQSVAIVIAASVGGIAFSVVSASLLRRPGFLSLPKHGKPARS